jgi:hypothetical protein
MDGFSIWYILITLLALFLYIGLPILAVRKTPADYRSSRSTFVKWFLGIVVVPTVINMVAGAVAPMAFFIPLIVMLLQLALIYHYFRNVAGRALDAGKGKGIAYAAIIPLAGFFIQIYLMFPASKVPAAADPEVFA